MTTIANPRTNGSPPAMPAVAFQQPQAALDAPLANLLDSDRFGQLQRVAKMMAHSTLTPKHLRGNTIDEAIGNCFRVVNQALRWGFDPFAVADESYVVGGKLGFQGKLVAAVVNSRAGLRERLRVEYSGANDQRTAKITGQFKDEETQRTIELSVQQAKTANEMWKKDPDQKLYYSGVIKWARRHCPELLLGTLTEDEVDAMRADTLAEHVQREPLRLPVGKVPLSQLGQLEIPTEVPTEEMSQPSPEEASQEPPATQQPDAAVSEAEMLAADLEREIGEAKTAGELTDLRSKIDAAAEAVGHLNHTKLTGLLVARGKKR